MTIKEFCINNKIVLQNVARLLKLPRFCGTKLQDFCLNLRNFAASVNLALTGDLDLPITNWLKLWLPFAKRGKTCKNHNFSQYADSVNGNNYGLWVDLGNTFFFMRKRFLRNK